MNSIAVLKQHVISEITLPPAPIERRCAWCDEEQGIRVHGLNITHGICPRHLVSNLVFYGQHDTMEALFYTILCVIAEGEE